eukprot:scaffold95408_cov15-Tisochrysis_lutea.AAC.1
MAACSLRVQWGGCCRGRSGGGGSEGVEGGDVRSEGVERRRRGGRRLLLGKRGWLAASTFANGLAVPSGS